MRLLTDKGWNKLSNQDEVKEVEVRALFNLIDKDQSGELSLEVKHHVECLKCLVIKLVSKLCVQEARKACKLIQARFDISEVDDWMSEVDSNQDGKLSFDEFKKSLDGKVSVTD